MKTKENKIDVAGVSISHPERIVFPDLKLTKLEVAEYYKKVSKFMLVELFERPLTLVRCPEGQSKPCFIQRHPANSVPKLVPQKKDGKELLLFVREPKDIIALVQMSVVEFHCWGSTIKNLDRPDRIIFDLDPDPGVSNKKVVETAFLLKDFLTGLKLKSYPRISGGKGVHVIVPIAPVHTWEQVKEFSLACTEVLMKEYPQVTNNSRKAVRKDKIYLDYLRNARSATAIANYSLRARPGAPVATPLTWEELKPSISFDKYNIENIFRRLGKNFKDPWSQLYRTKQILPK